MRQLLNLPKIEQKNLLKQFPSILKIDNCENVNDYKKIAISFFDHWLSESEAILLLNNVDLTEQKSRDAKFFKFHSKILENTVCFTYNLKGRYKHKAVFKSFKDIEVAKKYLEKKESSVSNKEMFKLVLPILNILYFEGFDDTCYLYFKEEKDIKKLFDWVKECGLHILF